MGTQGVRGFHLVARPPGVTSPYSHLVVDVHGMPHRLLTEFFFDLQKAHGKEGTPRTYLNSLLPYFTYLSTDVGCQGYSTHWDSPPEEVRAVVEEYLREQLGCRVQTNDTYRTVKLTKQSPSTVKLFLAALKRFYTFAKLVRAYSYEHPLIDQAARLFAEARREQERILQNHPLRPSVSGVAPPKRFLPENYYRLQREEWVPQSIDDTKLLKRLLKAAKKINLSLRDQLIVRMTAETGARISEVLGLTMGDWRVRGGRTQANTFNKGSRGRRTKYLVFTKETARLLQRYLNGERARLDSHHCRMNQLNDTAPLFLSERGHPYSYAAFYPHWRKVCRAANIRLTIHGMRHWQVTRSVRHIYSQKKQSQVELTLARERLIRYMAWRDPKTLEAYEHFFKAAEHVPVLAQIQKEMYASDARYVHEQERKQTHRSAANQPHTITAPPLPHHRPKARGSGWDELLAWGKKPGD